MTATTTNDRVSPVPQWLTVATLLTKEGMRGLLSATGVMAAVAVGFYLFARSQGWDLVQSRDDVLFGVVADQRSVVVVVASGWLPIAIGMAAIIISVILTATRTRIFISVGLTRHAITVGTALTAVVLMTYTVLVGGIVTLFLGPSAVAEFLGAGGINATSLMVVGASNLALGMVGAVSVTVLFLRWRWWVGVCASAVLALSLAFTGGLGVLNAGPAAVPWGLWLLTAALGVAYWAMMRRLPVH